MVAQAEEVEVRRADRVVDRLHRLAVRDVGAELALADSQRRLEARVVREQVVIGKLDADEAGDEDADSLRDGLETLRLVERVDVDLAHAEPAAASSAASLLPLPFRMMSPGGTPAASASWTSYSALASIFAPRACSRRITASVLCALIE